MGKAEREKYEKEQAEKHLKEMENEALLFNEDNNNDDGTATIRGRTTLGSSVFLAEEDWDSDEDDLSEYKSDDDDNYNIDISRVKLDQRYEKESSEMWGSKNTNQMAMEDIEYVNSNKKSISIMDTEIEEHGWDGEPTDAQENTIDDSDGSLAGRQRTEDYDLANRRLQAVVNGEEEEDKMDYEITTDRIGGLLEPPGYTKVPSENMQDGADAHLLEDLVTQLQISECGPSHYERVKIAQSSQITRRQIIDEEIAQENTMSPSTHILLLTDGNLSGQGRTMAHLHLPPQQHTTSPTSTDLVGETVINATQSSNPERIQATQGEEGMEAGSGNKPPSSTIESHPLHKLTNAEIASDRGESTQEHTAIARRTSPATWSQVTARGLSQGNPGSPSTHNLLGALTDEILTGEGSVAACNTIGHRARERNWHRMRAKQQHCNYQLPRKPSQPSRLLRIRPKPGNR